MPGTTTTHNDLVDIWNVKIGMSDDYAPSTANDKKLEAKILTAILSENPTSATSIADFKGTAAIGSSSATGSGLGSVYPTHKSAEIPGSDVQATQFFEYRNGVVVADFYDAEDGTTNAKHDGGVVIDPTSPLTQTTKILADSSAFENATVKFTVTDPYTVEGNTFSSGGFNGRFHYEGSKYRETRNVNA